MAAWWVHAWERLKDGVRQANAPRLPGDVDPVDNEPRKGRRRRPEAHQVGMKVGDATWSAPTVVAVAVPDAVTVDAGMLMDPVSRLSTEPQWVRQPGPGMHTWVVATWYAVDPLSLRDGGPVSLFPDQVVGILPPTCYFCEVLWSFEAARVRCPGSEPR